MAKKKQTANSKINTGKDKLRMTNLWKIASIAVISIFALMIIGGLVRVYHFRQSATPMSAEQIDSVKNVVLADLSKRGINATSEDIKVASRSRMPPQRSENDLVIEASANIGDIKNIYLLDANTKEILMHSQTQFYGWMNDSMKRFEGVSSKRKGFDDVRRDEINK